MNQKTVGLTLRAFVIALALILAASPGLPLLDGVAYAQLAGPTLVGNSPPGSTTVTLSWNEITDATGYQLVKQDRSVGNWSDPMAMSGTTYTDNAVTAGGTYGYYVRAVAVVDNGDGTSTTTEGTWSNYVEVSIEGGTTAPTGKPDLDATADGLTAVDLEWTAVTGATSYDLRRWNSETSQWDPIGNNPTGTSHNDPGRESGETYYYVIRAVNAGGNGPWSSADGVGVTAVTLPDTDPVPVLSLEHLSRERVKLTWTLVGEGAEYDLQRMTASPGATPATVTWARLPSGLLSDGEYTDEAATYVAGSTSTTYSYRVQSVVDGDQGDWSNVVSVSIPASGVLPPAPSLSTPSATSASSITVSWSAVPAAASYELRFKVEDGEYGTPFRATSPYVHSGRTPGTEYTYQVRSKNVNGYSDWSAAGSATTPAAASGTGTLPTPRNLRIEDATEPNDADPPVDVPALKVSWSVVTGATGYELLIWDNDENWLSAPLGATEAAIAEAVEDGTTTISGTVTDGGNSVDIVAGTTYYFVIRAVDDQGTTTGATPAADDDYSDWSAPANGRTKSVVPAAPTALNVLNRDSSSIWLSWTPATDADAARTTSYTVEWRQGTSQSRRTINVEGRTNFLHTGLTHNTEYFYRVRANNSAGSSGWWPNETTGIADTDTVTCATTTDDAALAQCRTTEMMGKTAARQLGPPSNFRSEAVSTTQIKLSWDAVTGATGYELQRWNTAVDPDAWVAVDLDASGTADAGETTTETSFTHTVTEPAAGGNVTEYFIIRTISSGGVMSAWSTALTAMSKSVEPGAPTLILVPTGQTTVRLSWSDGANTVAGQVTGYTVQFAEGAATSDNLDDERFASQTFTVSASPKYHIHTGLKTGTRYTYRIQANLANDVTSAWSVVDATTTGQVVTRPAKPELTATATISTTIRLTWDPAILAGDDLTAATAYEIQRRRSADDVATTGVDESQWVNVDVTLVDDTGGACDPMCIVDDGAAFGETGALAAGIKYFYRIRVNLDDTEVTGAPGVTSYWDQATARTPSN